MAQASHSSLFRNGRVSIVCIIHDNSVLNIRDVLLITRCAYAQGRVKRLSPSIYIYMYVCMYNVCRQKTRLFAVLLLENRHEIALYRSASQFIFFERCLQSRKSLLSSAMAMVSNSCTAPRGIEHYGNWVCRPTTSLRERWRKTMQIGSPSKRQELGREPFNTSAVKANNLLSFTE